MSKIAIDEGKCTGCGNCVETCENGILGLSGGEVAVILYPMACLFCLNCLYNCPNEAICVTG